MTVIRGLPADLRISGSGASASIARGTGNYSNDADNLRVGQAYSSGVYYCYRSFIAFDTSVIPDGDTVTAANLVMEVAADNDTVGWQMYLYQYNWKTVVNGTGTTGDRDNVFDMGTAGATDAAAAVKETPEVSTVGIAAGTELTFVGINTAWINKTGTTKYALKSKRDVDVAGPTGGENVTFFSGNAADETQRPALIITHGSQGVQRITRLFAQGVVSDSPFNQLA